MTPLILSKRQIAVNLYNREKFKSVQTKCNSILFVYFQYLKLLLSHQNDAGVAEKRPQPGCSDQFFCILAAGVIVNRRLDV
jgi:hypothetical protein